MHNQLGVNQDRNSLLVSPRKIPNPQFCFFPSFFFSFPHLTSIMEVKCKHEKELPLPFLHLSSKSLWHTSSTVLTKVSHPFDDSHHLWVPLHFTIVQPLSCEQHLPFSFSSYLNFVGFCSLHLTFACVKIFLIILSLPMSLLPNIFSTKFQKHFETKHSNVLSTSVDKSLSRFIWFGWPWTIPRSATLLELMMSKFMLARPWRASTISLFPLQPSHEWRTHICTTRVASSPQQFLCSYKISYPSKRTVSTI